MTSFDPNFEHFRDASGYRNRSTDHETKFSAFRNFVLGRQSDVGHEAFVIQFVCHPNFGAHNKEIIYYEHTTTGAIEDFEKLAELPVGYKRGNTYKNYKSNSGHPKGLFYELNLYIKNGTSTSQHHTSRVSGSNYERDSTHDKNHGVTKGKHWLD